jgi:hypothetical protein
MWLSRQAHDLKKVGSIPASALINTHVLVSLNILLQTLCIILITGKLIIN